ncbi:MAG: thermonuclease family protein [Candidatus Undinarchaeales archaeon]
MKKIIPLILIILVCGCISEADNSELEGPYLVTNVVDGDTLDLNNSARVRLSGIDTPERGECYYNEAKDALIQLTLDKEVFLERDKSNVGKYGRLLRYIYVENQPVNSILVYNGYAKVHDKYKNDTKKYLYLKKLEKHAVQNNLRVWSCAEG